MNAQLAAWVATMIIAAQPAFASPSAPFAQTRTGTATQAAGLKAGEVAVVGCLQRERDYRAIHAEGKGGVLGTGIGRENDYVIVNVMAAPPMPNAKASGTATKVASVYRLSGRLEQSLVRDVGRTVQIVGTVEEPSGGNDLPRLVVTLAHAVGDFCPAK